MFNKVKKCFVLRDLPAIRAAKAMMVFIIVVFLMICLKVR